MSELREEVESHLHGLQMKCLPRATLPALLAHEHRGHAGTEEVRIHQGRLTPPDNFSFMLRSYEMTERQCCGYRCWFCPFLTSGGTKDR
jgi:hypothetical protein